MTFTNSEDSALQSTATITNGQVAPSIPTKLPELGADGLYHSKTADEHIALLKAFPNKLIITKVFAPWCKACKAIEPKFLAITKDEKYKGLPIIYSSLSIAGNKEYVKSIGVLALPSMLFYAGAEGLQENFPCGPSKIPILKRKLQQFVNDYVDVKTKQLNVQLQPSDLVWDDEDEPCAERSIVDTQAAATDLVVGGVAVSTHRMEKLRQIPFFKDLSEAEFTDLFQKATLRSWDAGSVIMREGKSGRSFYILESGEVEILVKTGLEDPLTVPSNYMGTTLNVLQEGEYFGERALITGEPRAASVRTATKTRCFAFDKDDIPESSVLSGKGVATPQRLEEVNDKYGVDVAESSYLNKVQKQLSESQLGSQIRGSLNTPEFLPGVDSDEDFEMPLDGGLSARDDTIINLLQRLRIIKYATRCFDYIIQTRPNWSPGAKRRRSMLAAKLAVGQKVEFRDVFRIMDISGDGVVSLLELKRIMESVGEEKTDEELVQMLRSGSGVDGSEIITYDDFMGIMAEAEFYHLFTDTFASMDKENTGFVKVMELDRVLCGMRDLISDDRNMIIDVEDKEMMIDYEQFSRMLLGGELRSVAGAAMLP